PRSWPRQLRKLAAAERALAAFTHATQCRSRTAISASPALRARHGHLVDRCAVRHVGQEDWALATRQARGRGGINGRRCLVGPCQQEALEGVVLGQLRARRQLPQHPRPAL
ncbi:hypothetical protein GGF44_004049, partial [Coemansia sp. RSA 1694]